MEKKLAHHEQAYCFNEITMIKEKSPKKVQIS